MASSDVSSVINHFPYANDGFTTTLDSSILSGAATVGLTSVSGLTNGRIGVFIIEPGEAKEQIFTGTIDTGGSQITGVVWTRGTNVAHSAGVTIVDYVTGTHYNMLSKGIAVSHAQTGHIATTGVAEFTDHIDMADGKAIRDGNNNEVIKISQTASAVNEFSVKNAATGNPPELQATGGDTNIDIKIVPKGTGETKITNPSQADGYPIDWWQEIGRTTLTGAADAITVSGLPACTYLKIIFHGLTSGQISALMTFNGDTGNNYALRVSADGAADATSTAQAGINLQSAISAVVMADLFVYNRATQEKLVSGFSFNKNTAGEATAPSRRDIVAKWDNTADQISSVTITNTGTGDYATGAEIIVLGHN